VIQWHTLLAFSQQSQQPNNRGLYGTRLGAANAWFRLAYDLYLVEHNAELQRRLIRRLRVPASFQGARFETAVAAMMLASGYDLRFADEKGAGKHPEFYATHRKTSKVLAVEAKSKHRPGILGFEPSTPPKPPTSFNIDRLLFDAVQKDTQAPLMVFIELNSPVLMNKQTIHEFCRNLNASWIRIQELSWPNGFPCVGVIFYNDIAPWYLSDPLPEEGNSIWAFVLWPSSSRHSFDAKPLLNEIAQGCLQRCNIPFEFPNQG